MARYLTQRVLVSYLLKTSLQYQKPLHFEKCLLLSIFTCQKRLSHKDTKISDHTCEIVNYDDYRLNYKPIIHVVVQTLKEILNVSTYETNKILVNHPQLKKKSRANILNNYYNLLEIGIQKNAITKNIWLLAHDDTKLKEKLTCINTLNMNNEDLLPWLRFTQNELENNINYIKTDSVPYTYNKVEYLAHRLECSIQQFCILTVRCSFLLKIPVSYLDKKLNVLHEYDISNKDIIKDLWVLRYSENHIRHRCELYRDTGNLEIKTWAIRCPLQVISKAIEKNHASRNLLYKYGDINDFLLSKLNINEKDLETLIKKWPGILRINPIKLNKLISILHKSGITSNEILQKGGIIFYFNVQTIQNRINILNKNKISVKLVTLKLSEEMFKRYVEKQALSRKEDKLKNFYPTNKIYLMRKLNIDEEAMKNFQEKWPHAVKVNITKLELMLDMLHQYGFTNNEIVTHGRIVNFKVETLRERLEVLRKTGLIPKITVILFSKKDFDDFVRLRTTIK